MAKDPFADVKAMTKEDLDLDKNQQHTVGQIVDVPVLPEERQRSKRQRHSSQHKSAKQQPAKQAAKEREGRENGGDGGVARRQGPEDFEHREWK